MKRELFLAVAAGAALFAGCAHPATVGIVTPTPTPTATTPGSCATPDVTDANVVFVGVSPDMVPAQDSSSNSIFGYAPYINGDPPPQVSAVVTVTTTDIVQFLNVEPSGSTLSHSAVGFSLSRFPPVPYTFPQNSDTQVGTTITKAVGVNAPPWSTGEIAASTLSSTGTFCGSQVLRVPTAGTFFFGDFTTYNSAASMRGEIVVTP